MIGDYALTLALTVTALQVVLSWYGVYTRNDIIVAFGRRCCTASFALVSVAFIGLIGAFLNNDFSLDYVAGNSQIDLPWYYHISAAWSGHEGSMLLWVWVLTLWSALVARVTHRYDPAFRGHILTVLGLLTAGFLLFVIVASSPFSHHIPSLEAPNQPLNGFGFPLQGKDLNPLLQDIGLIIHPPLLYMGYVGFAVSFAFIVVALWHVDMSADVMRWLRPWAASAWSFLTLGIAVGSWWAYYELGWGGWWFWDPVENASLMPWLAGTALLHSISATEQRGAFKVWTAFLAITTFALSLLGTFLVRSGILTSVHAFASDTSRGTFILVLLAVIAGSGYALLMWRAQRFRTVVAFDWLSKEMALLVNNIVLMLACFVVVIGTLTPLLYDVMGWSRISVGAPYFNSKMLWLMIIMVVMMTFAPYLHWKRDRFERMRLPLIIIVAISLLLSTLINWQFATINWQALVLVALITSGLAASLWDLYVHRYQQRAKRVSSAYVAMVVAHGGFLLCCMGIILSSFYSHKKEAYISLDERIEVGKYAFTMKGTEQASNPVYRAVSVDFLAQYKDGEVLELISPEKRHYQVSKMPMTEAGLSPQLAEDIYITLGEPQDETLSAWSVRIQIKPYIRFIWIGAFIMALSALFVLRGRSSSRLGRLQRQRRQYEP